MSTLAPAAMFMLLVSKVMDWFKSVIPEKYNARVYVPLSMLIAVGIALAFGMSPVLADKITIFEDLTLANADVWARVLWGLCVGAGAGTIYDLANSGRGSDG